MEFWKQASPGHRMICTQHLKAHQIEVQKEKSIDHIFFTSSYYENAQFWQEQKL